jgi:hypothetical protein
VGYNKTETGPAGGGGADVGFSSEKFGREKTQGYLDAWEAECDELPSSLDDRSASYRHGWSLGRDDRLDRTPAPEEMNELRTEMALATDMADETV